MILNSIKLHKKVKDLFRKIIEIDGQPFVPK